jgi:glycine hydroxymethyltransferase
MDIDFFQTFQSLINATEAHEEYRERECINLIASESLKSLAVRETLCLSQDLESRYAEGENDLEGYVERRYYQGQEYITKIENHTADLMRILFNCSWIDLRLISGTMANLAAFKGISSKTKNNRMVISPLSCGAHISHDHVGLAGKVLGLETVDHGYNIEDLNIDPDKSASIIRKVNPGIVTFGGSLFLFPHPIKELESVAREVGAFIVYDAAHVLGLIAGGQFQDPLGEGADFITASTHKTFPGPQGGVILSNCEDQEVIRNVQRAVFPLTTSNTHLARLPAVGLAALEMKIFGEDLAEQTIKNAKSAAEYLFQQGILVLGERMGFTESHQIAVDVVEYGGGKKVANQLEKANIIVNKNMLPYDNPNSIDNPSGIRIGFQDVTRRGLKENDIQHLCDLIVSVITKKKNPSVVKKDSILLRQDFSKIQYGFESIQEATEYALNWAKKVK